MIDGTFMRWDDIRFQSPETLAQRTGRRGDRNSEFFMLLWFLRLRVITLFVTHRPIISLIGRCMVPYIQLSA